MQNSKTLSSFILFVTAAFSQTQVHFMGSIGISELYIFVLAPFFLIIDYSKLKMEGLGPLIWLSLCACVGCVVAAHVNGIPNEVMMKGLAGPYSIFSISVFLAHFLRRDFSSLKWLFIGFALSLIINVFVFQPETFTARGGHGYLAEGDAAVAAMLNYPLFWINRINWFARLPINCLYLRTPSFYSYSALTLVGFGALFFSQASGRSASLMALAGALIIFVCQKSPIRMKKFGRHIGVFAFVLLCFLMVFKVTYKSLAMEGLLGDEAKDKYIHQTARGDNVLAMIMSGRMEFFCGMWAASERPIIGWGYKAEDRDCYQVRYLDKFGNPEDYKAYIDALYTPDKYGNYHVALLPGHSCIAGFWVYYGIFGLLLWLYILWQIYRYYRYYASSVPQWFGYLGAGLPPLVWDIFFSPYGNRFPITMMIVVLMYAKAVYDRRVRLPYEMIVEIEKYSK